MVCLLGDMFIKAGSWQIYSHVSRLLMGTSGCVDGCELSVQTHSYAYSCLWMVGYFGTPSVARSVLLGPNKNQCRRLAESDISPILDNFSLAKSRVKCYSISILRPDLESSHQLASVRTRFDIIFAF